MKIYDKNRKVRVLRKNLFVANLNKRPKKIILLTIIFVVILLFTSPLLNLSIDMNKPIDDELIPFNDNPNLNGIGVSEFAFGVKYGPFNLEPQFAWDSSSIDVIDQVCEGLYRYNLSDPDLAIIPNLATAFGMWSSDKKNYTIPLREGVLFHDNTPFDASSVQWSFDRLQYFLNATGSLPGGKQVTQIAELYICPDGTPIINRTEIVNSYTIKFVLNKPYVPFLGLLCFSGSYILSPNSTPEFDYIDTNTGDLIGTGPFVYDKYNIDVNVTYHAFEYYWRGEAKIESLIFKIIYDTNARNNALLSGAVDLLNGISFSYLDLMESDPDITVTPCDQSLTIEYIGMNNKQINKTWRKAISYAINYSYIIEDLMVGQAVRMKSPVPEGILFANWSFDVATYNLIKAREYMVSMGYGDLGWSDATWQATTFATFNYTYNTGNWLRENLLTLLQDNLDLIGIEVTDAGMSWADYYNRIIYSHDKLQLYSIGWAPDYNDPSNFINPLLSNTSLSNSASVNDPYLESLMEAGLEETDPILREAIYDETQRYIVEDLMPWAFGYVGNFYDAYRSVFTGYPSNRMRKVWLYNVSLSLYLGGKIHINGNQEWLDFKNAGGCTGQGTYSDPYVIEDLIIGDIGGFDSCISIENSDVNFRIENCTLYNSYGGILLSYCNNSLISNNYISNMSYGINIQSSHNNTILRNTAVNSTAYGINLLSSHNNIIYLNNFINNGLDVWSSDSTNIWNSSVKIAYTYNNKNYFNYLGNYWDKYTGNDANNDGIGDTSYIIYENKEDNYPLMEPFENYLIPPAEDTTAPAAISDLTTSNPTENSVILNWTAPGDDGNTGTASGYIVKYSTSGPINDSNWDSASTYAQSWTPLTAGSKETHVVSGLDPDTQYWFAIKAYDEIPNYGYISNTASGKTFIIIPPVVDSPADITYEEGTTGHIISWNATDNNPGNYIIYREGVEIDSGSWTSGVAITINVDGLAVGSYIYIIEVTDAFNNTATDTVLVTVTSISPLIAGYPWIVLIFSLSFAISIVVLIIKRKITPKF